MKLYTSPFSPNARRARMAALLLGVNVDLVPVNLATGEQRKPEFLAINPNGRVPVLDDNGFLLWESHAIMAYLADTQKPGTPLYPADPKLRADVNRWLFWTSTHLAPALGALTFENVLKGFFKLGDPDAAQIKRQEDFVRTFGGVLDAHLAKHHWISGDAMTFADVSIACALMTAERAKAPIQGFTHVLALRDRMKALDAWKQTEPPPLP